MAKGRWMQGALLALLAAGCGPPRVAYIGNAPVDGAGGKASLDCDGTCASLAPADWTRDHFLLWTGVQADAPPCPANAPTLYREGYTDLIAPGGCDACTCNAPACVLPGGLTTSSSICPGSAPGSAHTNVDAPPAWDGACTPTGNVSVTASASMEISAPTVTACTPITVPVAAKLEPPSWGQYVLTCQGKANGRCEDPGSSCVPAPHAQFRLCIERDGMIEPPEMDACPEDYSERHLFYHDFDDQRSCTACACDSPIGSDCSALVSTYSKSSCMTLIGSLAVSQGSGCLDNVTGMGLVSVSASWITNEPGTCKPTGGELVGLAVPARPVLFCCQALQ